MPTLASTIISGSTDYKGRRLESEFALVGQGELVKLIGGDDGDIVTVSASDLRAAVQNATSQHINLSWIKRLRGRGFNYTVRSDHGLIKVGSFRKNRLTISIPQQRMTGTHRAMHSVTPISIPVKFDCDSAEFLEHLSYIEQS
jgi:hypothetical protein